MKQLWSLFNGPNGEVSSKRIFGIWCVVVSSVLAFIKGDIATIGIFMGAASAVFIGQAITKT
jgi:hypothetical protein